MLRVNNLVGFGAANPIPDEFSLVHSIVAGVDNDTWTQNGVSFGVAHPQRTMICVVTGHDAASETSYDVACTIGGVTATRAALSIGADGSDSVFASVFIAGVPSGTTGNVVVTLTSYGGTWDDYAMALWRSTGLASVTPTQIKEGNLTNATVPTKGFFVGGTASIFGTLGSSFSGAGATTILSSGRTGAIMSRTTPGTVSHSISNGGSAWAGAAWSF